MSAVILTFRFSTPTPFRNEEGLRDYMMKVLENQLDTHLAEHGGYKMQSAGVASCPNTEVEE